MEDNKQKALTLGNMEALSNVIATKEEVKKQIQDAGLSGTGAEFATDEEVLALFQEPAPESPTE